MGNFIAACNINDSITDFLETGVHTPKQSVMTYSNAMDVGNPSNLIRILEIYQHNLSLVKSQLSSSKQTDDTTIHTIESVYKNSKYILDPHAAVGYSAISYCPSGKVPGDCRKSHWYIHSNTGIHQTIVYIGSAND